MADGNQVGWSLTDRLKIAAGVVALILTVIVVLQNTETVDTRLLFTTISMPRAALLFGTLVLGFVVGMLTTGWLHRRRRRKG